MITHRRIWWKLLRKTLITLVKCFFKWTNIPFFVKRGWRHNRIIWSKGQDSTHLMIMWGIRIKRRRDFVLATTCAYKHISRGSSRSPVTLATFAEVSRLFDIVVVVVAKFCVHAFASWTWNNLVWFLWRFFLRHISLFINFIGIWLKSLCFRWGSFWVLNKAWRCRRFWILCGLEWSLILNEFFSWCFLKLIYTQLDIIKIWAIKFFWLINWRHKAMKATHMLDNKLEVFALHPAHFARALQPF